MSTRHDSDDRLDEVLAEIEQARRAPAWTPEPQPAPRRLLRAPKPLEEARWAPSRTAIVVVLMCSLLALVIFGMRVMLSSQRSTPSGAGPSTALQVAGRASVAPATSGGGAQAQAPSGNAVSPTTSASSPGVLHIHVVGAVRSSGVVTVPAGSRVADAVQAAGGLKGADAAGINLARALSDGEQVYVPKPGESPRAPAPGASNSAAAPGAASSGGAPATSSGGAQVDLNTADAATLDTLPGVGPVLAQRIIDWRTEHGKFTSVDELGEVSGIGDKALERLRPKVAV